MSKIKKSLSRLTATGMVARSKFIEDRMKDNPAFPTPTPSLSAIADARTALEAAITAAIDGGRTARAIRNTRQAELKLLLDQLSGYVSSRAEGNELAILSSGFEVRRTGKPLPEPLPPVNVRAELTMHPGRVALNWERTRGAVTFHVQVNRGAPENKEAWELVGVTTKSRFTITGLASAQVHWFRVAAIGTVGMSAWSDVAQTVVR